MSKEVKDRYGRTLLNKLDRFVDYARETSSRGAAFLYAVLGVLAQVAHNSLLAYDVSLFENEILKVAQAMVVAMAISFALLYFVLTADGKEYTKSGSIIKTFYTLEVFLNIVYYLKKIVFDIMYEQVQVNGGWNDLNWSQPNWFLLLIGIPFAIFIPFIIKSYAGSISAHKPALALDEEDFVKDKTIDERLRVIAEELNSKLDEKLSDYEFDVKTDVSEQIDEKLAKKFSKKADEIEKTIRYQIENYNEATEKLQNEYQDAIDSSTTVSELKEQVNTLEEAVKNVKLPEDFTEKLKDELLKSSDIEDQIKNMSDFNKQQLTEYYSKVDNLFNQLNSAKDEYSNANETLTILRDKISKLEQTNQKLTNDVSETLKTAVTSGSKIRLRSGDKSSDFTIEAD